MQRRRRINSITASPESGGITVSPQAEDMDVAINTFLRYCNVRNLTSDTLRYYTECLAILKRMLAEQGITRPIDVTKDTIYSAIERRKEEVSEETVNTNLRAWRVFFNFLAEENYLMSNPFSGIKLIKTEKRVIETFSKEQIRRLLEIHDRQTFTGYRNYVFMSFLLETGARVSEAVGIRTTDIQWRERLVKLDGKGRKERLVPFQSRMERHLREYLKIRGLLDHDFVFVNIDNEPWKLRSAQEMITLTGMEAGIKGVRCSAHTFRHTFARLYIVNGGDPFSLQKILGHTTLDMVKTYVNLWSADIAGAHAKYSPLERLDED
ncbi:tyrosine recombinase XerC [Paenibacillus cisolokensis]|uniref:Tyrosine recombinase XerC n=1 Tax=Paenibacillus cisolokensis TaxID=1658519 RepID=A0ABQ4N5S9_9BACL|nr:tyrosine-type recombinase/integrase [Paenibacillus cisolokensis]GIQ63553.1 tyrosine recombinase XerC [Paenibacillus cisolokensis]